MIGMKKKALFVNGHMPEDFYKGLKKKKWQE